MPVGACVVFDGHASMLVEVAEGASSCLGRELGGSGERKERRGPGFVYAREAGA